jgi:hypothetical protein
MNWLERARREISKSARRGTATIWRRERPPYKAIKPFIYCLLFQSCFFRPPFRSPFCTAVKANKGEFRRADDCLTRRLRRTRRTRPFCGTRAGTFPPALAHVRAKLK